MDTIPFNKPFIAGKELFYIAQAVIENSHTAGDGPFTKKCQQWLEQKLGCRKALLTHSCTAALETVSYTHLRAHETVLDLVCRLLLEKKN